ncbi:MAG: efflux RND transporter periplasmic adaptor subunit [Acidobacteriota bacterium]
MSRNRPDHIGRASWKTLLPLIFLLPTGCSKPRPEASSASEPTAPRSNQVVIDRSALDSGRIQIDEVRRIQFSQPLVVTGQVGVNERRTVRMGALADGRIVRVLADVGDHVTRGQKLAELSSHEVHDARADFAKAQAEMSKRQTELEFARNAHARTVRLHELKAASVEQLQRAEADLRAAELAVTQAQADIGRIEDHLHHLGLSSEGAVEEYGRPISRVPGQYDEQELIPVLAPLPGTVLKRLVSQGTVVTSSDDLFVVSDLSSLWVKAAVPERYLPRLKTGQAVRIQVQAYPSEDFPARVSQIGDTLDPETRTIQVRCETNNVRGKLKPEMYATVLFEIGESAEVLAVPQASLEDINGKSTVFVAKEGGLFEARSVRTGRQTDGSIEILEGLRAGEKVASAGSFLLKSEFLKAEMSPD